MDSEASNFSEGSLNLAMKFPKIIGKTFIKAINGSDSNFGRAKNEYSDGNLLSPIHQSKLKRRLKYNLYDLSKPISILKVGDY